MAVLLDLLTDERLSFGLPLYKSMVIKPITLTQYGVTIWPILVLPKETSIVLAAPKEITESKTGLIFYKLEKIFFVEASLIPRRD